MPKFWISLLITLLLVGCATSSTPYQPPVKVRDTIVVNVAFADLSNATRINFQNGQRIADGNLDKWTTYCRLYVYNRNYTADYVTSVKPGEFEIVAVKLRYDIVDTLDRPRVYASLFWRDYTPPSFYLYKVGMRLTSADQPDVHSLDCYRKWSTRGRYYPTLVEIRQALGDLVEIRSIP